MNGLEWGYLSRAEVCVIDGLVARLVYDSGGGNLPGKGTQTRLTEFQQQVFSPFKSIMSVILLSLLVLLQYFSKLLCFLGVSRVRKNEKRL